MNTMSKIWPIFACLVFVAACTKSNQPAELEEGVKYETSDIIGVWRDGEGLISFNTDGYYSASLTSLHLDTGSFTIEDTVITCSNNYNNKTTTYILKEIKDNTLKCSVTFSEYESEDITVERTFAKTDEKPSAREHFLVGKSWSFLSSDYSTIFEEFTSYYLAQRYSTKDRNKYKSEWYYFYIEPLIYLQSFNPKDGVQRPTSSFNRNNDSGEVQVMKAVIYEGIFGGVSREL